MKKWIFMGIVLFMAYPVAAVVIVPPPQPLLPPPNVNSLMAPAAQNMLTAALQLREEAHSLLDQATQKGLDVSAISESIAGADTLVEQAQKIAIANPIPASNLLREAIALYEKAIADLKTLLG